MIKIETKRILGIDWGSKRIGLALADSDNRFAVPFKVVNNLEDIKKIIQEEEINKIILGLPKAINGNTGLNADFKEFVWKLKSAVRIDIELFDERLSSKAADALPGDKKIKAPRDAVAAMIILQSYLDKISALNQRSNPR